MTSFGPELNDGHHILVFGSNLAGRHGAGTALYARQHWGARYGSGIGRQGQSYAIPTKDERLRPITTLEISGYVHDFLDYVVDHPEFTFLITPVGCGLAGNKPSEMARLFRTDCSRRCIYPDDWSQYINCLGDL